MKNFITKFNITVLFLFFPVFIYSQTDPANFEFENTDSVINYLEGEWEWISSCGGQLLECRTPDNLGYERMLSFKRLEGFYDSIEIVFYREDTLFFMSGSKIEGIQFGSWNLPDMSWQIEAETKTRVFFHDLGADGYTHLYERRIPVTVEKKTSQKTDITIFPNPCSDMLKLNVEKGEDLEYVYIYNVNGAVVKVCENYMTNCVIDISGIPKGLYFVKVIAGDTEVMEKFIKE